MLITIKHKTLCNNLTQEPLECFTCKYAKLPVGVNTDLEMLYIIQAAFLLTNDYCNHYSIIDVKQYDLIYDVNFKAIITLKKHLSSLYDQIIEKSIVDFREKFIFEGQILK